MPILDHIPREIFETILHFCVGFDTPVRDLVRFQLVCRSWRDIIAETAFLWGTISAREGSRAFRKAFQMAKNSPLDIIFTDEGATQASDFFSLTGKKIDQWRSLAIEAYMMEEALAIIQTQKPPRLSRLFVQSRWMIGPGAGIVLFGGAPATGLEVIRLIGVPINLSPLRLSDLKSLHLEQIPGTKEEIRTILNNSPNLETLGLVQLSGAVQPTEPATGEPNLPPHSPIHLPLLTKLELNDLPLHFLGFLLSNLAVSRLRFLKIIAKKWIAQHLAADMHQLTATLIPVTSGVQKYEVRMSSGFEITIGGLCIDLTWPSLVSMGRFEETLDRLADHLTGVMALVDMPLHLTLEGPRLGLSCLEWFTRRANVTWLTVSNTPYRGYDLVGIISLLGRPTSGPSPIWLLPQLEVFETNLACTESQGLIVDMIKARHAALPESFPGLYGASPKRFQEIQLSHGWDEFPMPSPLETFMSEVVQAAEGAEVYWGGRKWSEFRDTGSPGVAGFTSYREP